MDRLRGSGRAMAAPTSVWAARSTTIVTWPNAVSNEYPLAVVAMGCANSTASRPAASASSSVTPVEAASGSVYVQRGWRGNRAGRRRRAPCGRRSRPGSGSVRVQLGPGRVADQVQAVLDPQPPVGLASPAMSMPTVSRWSGRQRERPADGEQDAWPSTSSRCRAGSRCAPSVPPPASAFTARTPGRTSTPSRIRASLAASELRGWSGRGDAGCPTGRPSSARRSGRRPGQLDAGRPPPRTSRLLRQLTGGGRVLVRPGVGRVSILDRAASSCRADGEIDVRGASSCVLSSWPRDGERPRGR